MPDILRQPIRMDCLGLDLVHPVDRMPPGYFPYIYNCRVIEEGRIEGRPGYQRVNRNALAPNALHSIRRLNDVSMVYSPAGYTYIVGNGDQLQAGQEAGIAPLQGGYSGDPLSLLTFRPQNSPASWMYVYDRNKQTKVRADGVTRDIGVAPPQEPAIEYGPPAMATINDGATATGWVAYDAASAPTTTDRTVAAGATIGSITYDAGTTGWCCINPIGGVFAWAGERMRVVLNSAETVQVREIHNAISATTVQAIQYDTGTTGLCSIVLTGSPTGLERNSLITVGPNLAAQTDVVRVLAVILSPDGLTYSIRCSIPTTHLAGEAVLGIVSWYVYTTINHVVTETITLNYVAVTSTVAAPTTNPAAVALLSSISAATAAGRPISVADDYMHVSLFLQNPQNVIQVQIQIDIDVATTTVGVSGNAFTRNFWTWTITPDQLNQYGPGDVVGNSWTEILVPISSGQRSGSDQTRTFANIKALQIQLQTTGGCSFGFDCWYFMGTYGPFVQPNSPVGLLYQTTNRDSSTGAASVPGPPTRYELFPLREEVIVTPTTSTEAGVDSLDIYRQGGTITHFTYVGTVANNTVTPNSFLDTQPDALIAASASPDLTLIQPWPELDNAWTGVVNVVGTSVTWVSGTLFNVNLLAATVITINGINYQVHGNPKSTTFLELTASAGAQSVVPYSIASPTIAAQPLAFVFGPLEGPFAPVAFGLGDRKNAGTLYYSNTSNLDAASDANTIELCAPSEPLISGAVWNGFAICGSRDNIFSVKYSYLTTLGVGSAGSLYQFLRLPSASGMWSRWACCRGPNGVYFLGRDGVYLTTDQGSVNITDAQLYPLFPHDGMAAAPILTAGAEIDPVDMTLLNDLRLSYCDGDIYFDFVDIRSNNVTLRYEIEKKRWFLHYYGDGTGISTHYLVEASDSLPKEQTLFLLSRSLGYIYKSGGDTDDSVDVNSLFNTPSYDGGDERAQKLYIDQMTDADGIGLLTVFQGYDNNLLYTPAQLIGLSGTRVQTLINISNTGAGLALQRNISFKYSWKGGPDGPRVYAVEPSGYAQPYLSKLILTQFINLSFPGWKHHRRLYAGLISTADVVFTIKTQNGKTFIYHIPSTAGQFKIQPMMIDQTCKDLSFAYQLDGNGTAFALFPEAFTLETKQWVEPDYIELAVFKT